MAKTKRRTVNKSKKTRTKRQKYVMKGCYKKSKSNGRKMMRCKLCNRVHSGKHQSGGCNCQSGGNSIGLYQNAANVGNGFLDSLTGIYNGFNGIPQPISSDPTMGHFAGISKFHY